MKNFPNEDLVALLADDTPGTRMLALHFLSEGYADQPEILPAVFAAWDRWGATSAFPEFPLISYVCIPKELIGELLQRAQDLVLPGHKLTELSTRCAGKLVEQLCNLPAKQLSPHQINLENLTTQSKIFFRVDTRALAQRIGMMDLSADQLAERLDHSIETLTAHSENAAAFTTGLHALEALRSDHPGYIDMATAISNTPPDHGARAISFQLSMHSLIQTSQAGTEAALATHLLDPREAILSNAIEAMVKLGTPLAAACLISQFELASESGQRWIARGLQRVRGLGLADEIANLRDHTVDPALWGMLLVAEVRQFEVASLPRIVDGLQRVQAYSGALMDALNVYVRIHERSPGSRLLQQTFMDYLQRIKHLLKNGIS